MYDQPTLPELRGKLDSELIRDEFGKIASEFLMIPETLGPGLRGFKNGRWDGATLNSPNINAGVLGTNLAPVHVVGHYTVFAQSTITTLGSGNVGWIRGLDGRLKLMDGLRIRLFSDNAHNIVIGSGETENETSASTGFFYVGTTNGIATGSPTSYIGAVAMTVDRAAKKIGLHIGGTWVWTAALT